MLEEETTKAFKIVHLCKGCIEDLKEYNPYIVPIKVVEVPIEECDNTAVWDIPTVDRNKNKIEEEKINAY